VLAPTAQGNRSVSGPKINFDTEKGQLLIPGRSAFWGQDTGRWRGMYTKKTQKKKTRSVEETLEITERRWTREIDGLLQQKEKKHLITTEKTLGKKGGHHTITVTSGGYSLRAASWKATIRNADCKGAKKTKANLSHLAGEGEGSMMPRKRPNCWEGKQWPAGESLGELASM